MKVSITSEKIKEIAQELEAGMQCYYHIPTGETEAVPDELKSDGSYDEELWKDILKKIKKNRRQYICFEAPGSHDSFRMMEQYAEGITQAATRNFLLERLTAKKPFSGFRQALQQYPELLQEWYEFKSNQYIQLVQQQLEAYNFTSEG